MTLVFDFETGPLDLLGSNSSFSSRVHEVVGMGMRTATALQGEVTAVPLSKAGPLLPVKERGFVPAVRGKGRLNKNYKLRICGGIQTLLVSPFQFLESLFPNQCSNLYLI